MANINQIRVGVDQPDAIMYDKIYYPKYKNIVTFGSFVPKDNTANLINDDNLTKWQVNDGWEIERLSDTRIAIKKFKIDTWGIRLVTNNTNIKRLSSPEGRLRVSVEGIEYVHNNVVCHTAGSSTPDGFTKAYAGTAGYNVYWYPGQYSSGNFFQGLGIQFGWGYSASNDERDDGFQMGKHPWDIGQRINITDGIYHCIECDTAYSAVTIGLFGGVQNATAWHDESTNAYKQYDITDHPIYIDLEPDLPEQDYPVDFSSVECWKIYHNENDSYKLSVVLEDGTIIDYDDAVEESYPTMVGVAYQDAYFKLSYIIGLRDVNNMCFFSDHTNPVDVSSIKDQLMITGSAGRATGDYNGKRNTDLLYPLINAVSTGYAIPLARSQQITVGGEVKQGYLWSAGEFFRLFNRGKNALDKINELLAKAPNSTPLNYGSGKNGTMYWTSTLNSLLEDKINSVWGVPDYSNFNGYGIDGVDCQNGAGFRVRPIYEFPVQPGLIYNKDKTFENCWKKYKIAVPYSDPVTVDKLDAGDYKIINPTKIKLNKLNSGDSITVKFTSTSFSGASTSVNYPQLIVKISGLTDQITAQWTRDLINTQETVETSNLTNGENIIPEYNQILHRIESSSAIQYNRLTMTFTANVNYDKPIFIEFIPNYDSSTYTLVTSAPVTKMFPNLTSAHLPRITDLEDHISSIKWQFVATNADDWGQVKDWYEYHEYPKNNFQSGSLFSGSNLNQIVITMPNSAFLFGEDNFNGSTINKIIFQQTASGSRFSSPQRLLRGTSYLREIELRFIDETETSHIFGVTSLANAFGFSGIETYPAKLINWSSGRTIANGKSIPASLFQYCFDNCKNLKTIPSFPVDGEPNTIVPTSGGRSFNNCINLESIGPTINAIVLYPESANLMFQSCNKLTDMKLVNLSHGDWIFDGVSRGGITHGNLTTLNETSIKTIFDSLVDLTTHDASKHEDNINKSFKNWESDYREMETNNVDWDYTIRTVTMLIARKRYATSEEAELVVKTNQNVTDMSINVSGLLEGDQVIFGGTGDVKYDYIITANGSYTINSSDLGIYEGFKIISSDTSRRDEIIITVNGLDDTNPKVDHASLYCPEEWRTHITSEMLRAAKTKGWTVYINNEIAE